MPRFDDTILQSLPDPALIASHGRVVCFNAPAGALFDGLGENAPLPDALCVPTGGASLISLGGACWTCSAVPVRECTLLLLHPARLEGMSDAQLDGIARRLREQMAQLMLSSQLLSRSLPAQGADCAPLAAMNRALCQMLRLTDRLELLHEITGGAFRFRAAVLDLAGLCRETTDVAASLLESAGVTLEYTSPVSSVLVRGDGELLRTLVLELISNAARAAGRGGRLRLSLSRREDRVLLTLSGGGREDSGRPLAALLEGCADPARTPQPGEGAGVGLSLIVHIVRLHGGSLVMERQDGVSAALSLPVVRSRPPARVSSPRTDYSGGFPAEFVALSDVLPDSVFAAPEL